MPCLPCDVCLFTSCCALVSTPQAYAVDGVRDGPGGSGGLGGGPALSGPRRGNSVPGHLGGDGAGARHGPSCTCLLSFTPCLHPLLASFPCQAPGIPFKLLSQALFLHLYPSTSAHAPPCTPVPLYPLLIVYRRMYVLECVGIVCDKIVCVSDVYGNKMCACLFRGRLQRWRARAQASRRRRQRGWGGRPAGPAGPGTCGRHFWQTASGEWRQAAPPPPPPPPAPPHTV